MLFVLGTPHLIIAFTKPTPPILIHPSTHSLCTMSESSTPAIPAFYRIFFTYIDPLVASWGAYMDFFTPDTVLNSFVPNSARNPAHDMLFQQLGGGLLNIAFLSAVLLRYTNDVKIWKIVQLGILIVDVVGLYSLWDGLGRQGRLDPRGWRGEDWGCVGITGFVTVLRMMFMAEVGFRSGRARMKRDGSKGR